MVTEETLAKVKVADDLIAKGLTKKSACKKAGISTPTWYLYKKPKEKRSWKRKSQVIAIPTAEPSPSVRLIALIGSPTEVLEAIRGLS